MCRINPGELSTNAAWFRNFVGRKMCSKALDLMFCYRSVSNVARNFSSCLHSGVLRCCHKIVGLAVGRVSSVDIKCKKHALLVQFLTTRILQEKRAKQLPQYNSSNGTAVECLSVISCRQIGIN